MVQAASRAKRLDLVFGAVSHETRRSILDRLRGGSMTVTELAGAYTMSLNAVSKHIKTLEHAGLIHRSVHGREHTIELDTARFDEALAWMRDCSEFWRGRMDALERHLEKKREAP